MSDSVNEKVLTYGVYRGDILICLGSRDYCAEHLGLKPETVEYLASPEYKREIPDKECEAVSLLAVKIECSENELAFNEAPAVVTVGKQELATDKNTTNRKPMPQREVPQDVGIATAGAHQPYKLYKPPMIIDTSSPGKTYCSVCQIEVSRFTDECQNCGARFEGRETHDA